MAPVAMALAASAAEPYLINAKLHGEKPYAEFEQFVHSCARIERDYNAPTRTGTLVVNDGSEGSEDSLNCRVYTSE